MFFKDITHPLVFDGAMGTMIQASGLSDEDFGGFPGLGEMLNLVRPDIIASIHRAYYEAGSDVVTTNTFGATRIVLGEYDLEGKVGEINTAAARIARTSADEALAGDGRPRYVVGELGPTSKLPTLGHMPFEEMEDAYAEQAGFLVAAGVDGMLIATAQDILQVKAAASGARIAMDRNGQHLPIIISVTVESNGAMLVGTRLAAALASIEPYGPAAFGINCALGPDLMEEYLAELARISPLPIICQPNAGLPRMKGGKTIYPLSPHEFARAMAEYAERFGLSAVGGCCGTSPEHIRELAAGVKGMRVNRDAPAYRSHAASLYSAVALDQEPRPLIIAEQTNANGSRKFRDLVQAGDWDGCVALGRKAAEGSHVLDLSVALPGIDETAAMHQLVPKFVASIDRPLVIDSTSLAAIEAALSHCGGRAIINSINLEDGGEKALRIIGLAKRFGAALVGLTIDEQGMAATAERKVEVARRIVDIAMRGGLRVEDLLIDPLVFTLASGDPSTAGAGRETLRAIGMIKKEIPGIRVSLGVSNVSFGLMPRGRKALTSYFLHRAIEAGVDVAIINARTIVPSHRIDGDLLPLVERLVNGDSAEGDPLAELLEILMEEGPGKRRTNTSHAPESPIEALQQKVVDGDRSDLEGAVARVLEAMEARAVVNDVLMPAMKTVGEYFGKGTMPLPFVLQSAETMRAAVDILAPLLTSDEAHSKGTIVLATVRGDVHDIGKNLVDAILSNNGFRVINLGIRQGAARVMEAVAEHKACAIGLSGLLVSSTEIMREDLEVFGHNGIAIPVLCGGAALTEKFTRDVLAPAYGSDVHYCADAFDGLKAMEEICG